MNFFTMCIWGNEILSPCNKPLFYTGWIKSNFIYVKDLFDENGLFISEANVIQRLSNTANWIAEYYTLKQTITKLVTRYKFDTRTICYINIKENSQCKIFDGYHWIDIILMKSKCFFIN